MSLQTYFDLCPKELVALCIPDKNPDHFLKLFKNPKQLFKIKFKDLYPNYFDILEFDWARKISKHERKGIFTHLFHYFKQNFDENLYTTSYGNLKHKHFDLIYPVLILRDYHELYIEISKYKNLNIKYLQNFRYKDVYTIILYKSYMDFFRWKVNDELKVDIIKFIQGKIMIFDKNIHESYINAYINTDLYKYLYKERLINIIDENTW